MAHATLDERRERHARTDLGAPAGLVGAHGAFGRLRGRCGLFDRVGKRTRSVQGEEDALSRQRVDIAARVPDERRARNRQASRAERERPDSAPRIQPLCSDEPLCERWCSFDVLLHERVHVAVAAPERRAIGQQVEVERTVVDSRCGEVAAGHEVHLGTWFLRDALEPADERKPVEPADGLLQRQFARHARVHAVRRDREACAQVPVGSARIAQHRAFDRSVRRAQQRTELVSLEPGDLRLFGGGVDHRRVQHFASDRVSSFVVRRLRQREEPAWRCSPVRVQRHAVDLAHVQPMQFVIEAEFGEVGPALGAQELAARLVARKGLLVRDDDGESAAREV